MPSPEQKIAWFHHHLQEGNAEKIAMNAHALEGPQAISALQIALDSYREGNDSVVYAVANSLAARGAEAAAALPSLRATLMYYDINHHGGSSIIARTMVEIDPSLQRDGFVMRCLRQGMQRAEAEVIARWTGEEARRSIDEFIRFEQRQRPYQFEELPSPDELRDFRDFIRPTNLEFTYKGPFAALRRIANDDTHLILVDPGRFASPASAEAHIKKLLAKLGPSGRELAGLPVIDSDELPPIPLL